MQYLEKVSLPTRSDEEGYFLSYPPELEMQCYQHNNTYPFRVFPDKELSSIAFSPITVFYGGNGSGKSTLLNIIAEKLSVHRKSPFNETPFLAPYLDMVDVKLSYGKRLPEESKIITSDDVFDFLLDIRMFNRQIDRRRAALFEEYDLYTDPSAPHFQLRSLEDYEELKRRNAARHKTKSAYTAPHLPKETGGSSNGESAFLFFTREIGENALYLLDEPENSLSAKLQIELAHFIEDAVRFYGCQFVISTHSPFLLALKGAKIYDLDARPVTVRPWYMLENVKIYRDFFEEHREEFDQ